MSLIGTELKTVWNVLRASKPQRKFSLKRFGLRTFVELKTCD